MQKTVLLVDDEQGLIEALGDALASEGHRVLRARTVDDALRTLGQEKVDLATVDIMMPPGSKLLESQTDSHRAGLFLCGEIKRKYPRMPVFCLSVVSDRDTIRSIQSLGYRFLKKGETPLSTVLDMIRSRLTGIAYASDEDRSRRFRPI